jgi:STE24 endopeptidase
VSVDAERLLTLEDIDSERQREARSFARLRYRLLVVDLTLGGGLALLFLLSGGAVSLKGWVMAGASHPVLIAGGYFVLVYVGYGLVTLPLEYYGGFVLPHRYGLSNQTLGAWLVDQAKSGLVALAMGLVVVEVIYFLLRVTPELWWLVAGVFLLLLTVVLANLAPVLLVPLFYKLRPLADEELSSRLQRLAARSRAGVVGVWILDLSSKTSAANAMIMGLGNTRRIVLGDTLYGEYGPDEIEAIVAHELGHHVARDMWWGMLFQAGLTLAGLYVTHLALIWGTGLLGLSGVDDVAGLPLLGLVMGAFMTVTTPLGNSFSRWREGRADDYALRATERPEAFVSAMVRLANQNLADVDPERWVELLLLSHPAIGKRIGRGLAYAGVEGRSSGAGA